MRAITMEEFGGPEVLRLTEVPDLRPRRAHHLLRVTRAGVNYADVHVRGNTYLAPVKLPYIPGNEVVGATEDGQRFVGLFGFDGIGRLPHALSGLCPQRHADTDVDPSGQWAHLPARTIAHLDLEEYSCAMTRRGP